MKRSTFLKASGGLIAGLSLPSQFSAHAESTDLNFEGTPKIIKDGDGTFYNVLGDRMRVKLNAADTNGLFTLIEEEHDPGTQIPMHVHRNEDEVFRVLEGAVEFTIGDETMVLGPGDTGFAPRNIPHTWKNVGDKKAKVIMSVFPAGLEAMFAELDALPPGPPDFPKVAGICAQYGVEFLT